VFSNNAVVYPISRNEFRNEWRESACSARVQEGWGLRVWMGANSRKCISHMLQSFRELKSVEKTPEAAGTEEGSIVERTGTERGQKR